MEAGSQSLCRYLYLPRMRCKTISGRWDIRSATWLLLTLVARRILRSNTLCWTYHIHYLCFRLLKCVRNEKKNTANILLPIDPKSAKGKGDEALAYSFDLSACNTDLQVGYSPRATELPNFLGYIRYIFSAYSETAELQNRLNKTPLACYSSLIAKPVAEKRRETKIGSRAMLSVQSLRFFTNYPAVEDLIYSSLYLTPGASWVSCSLGQSTTVLASGFQTAPLSLRQCRFFIVTPRHRPPRIQSKNMPSFVDLSLEPMTMFGVDLLSNT